ncbi:hypothetical protein KOEU_38280 [Komagataeibacter europaeus]|uniref:Uncharacterized protein n=1 Tax=Komagataeibacter europaeus TaxID=33995 RepID=A0A0M0EBR7_KOMEU|nr:hypothetical protein KOEU_38280 [Komagataeibacter europaeus]
MNDKVAFLEIGNEIAFKEWKGRKPYQGGQDHPAYNKSGMAH